MAKILLIDDEKEQRQMFQMRLLSLGFESEGASSGNEAFKMLEQSKYDLILLDILMPVMDGFTVLEKLKNNYRTRDIPVVMLTSSTRSEDELKGIELGADDFLTKNADRDIILARIKNTLKKHKRIMGLNPLTGLAGNLQIEEHLLKRISSGELFAVGYADLDHFKEFNDIFGFKKGDEVIKITADLLLEAIKNEGSEEDFVGHVGGDDFIFITNPEMVENICRFIIEKAEIAFLNQYPQNIREQGYIMAKNRRGEVEKIDLLSLSVAVVTNKFKPLHSPSEISSIASEIKKKAKSIKGNSYYIDRRKN